MLTDAQKVDDLIQSLEPAMKRLEETEKSIKLFAKDIDTGEHFEITDLYWFEENGIRDFGGEGDCRTYVIEVYINGVCVYPYVIGKQSD